MAFRSGAPDDKGSVDESPEQVLARLARHRDSIYRARGISIQGEGRGPGLGPTRTAPRSGALSVGSSPALPVSRALAPPIGAWGSPQPTPTEFVPSGSHVSERGWQLTQSAVLVTILGLLLAVVASAVAVLSFEELSSTAALVVVAVMVLAGLAATARRVPAALWFTMGAAIGGVLGRWS